MQSVWGPALSESEQQVQCMWHREIVAFGIPQGNFPSPPGRLFFIYDIVLYMYIGREIYIYIYRERDRERERKTRERCIVDMYKYIYIYICVYVSDLLIHEDRSWYCTQCDSKNIWWAQTCGDCDYPRQLRKNPQDNVFVYDVVVHMMYTCMHEAFTGRSSGSGCFPAMAAPPKDGHDGSAHGPVVCSGRRCGPVCTRQGIGSAA